MTDLIWTLISFLLTLLVLSYIFGDNVLFRLATYFFVGVTAAYVLVVTVIQVIWPKLVYPLTQGNLLTLVPLVLVVMLAAKVFPRLARFGSLPMAFLVGTAAAVAIGGAVFGTLVGQSQGAIQEFNLASQSDSGARLLRLVEALFLLLGTISTLVYFQYSARPRQGQAPTRTAAVETLSQVGQLFIAITLGALFAGVFSSSITAMIERLDFLYQTAISLLGRIPQ